MRKSTFRSPIAQVRRPAKCPPFLLPLILSFSLLTPCIAQTAAPPEKAMDQNPISATVTVDPSRIVRPIPRTVFGTFLEPIARSTYGGFWAELLENPGFEPNMWSPGSIARILERREGLRRASDLGLPLPWEPLYADQAVRYEPRVREVAGGYQSLFIMALPQGETGVRQEVYLPVHRTRRYVGYLSAKPVSGPRVLEVSLRRRNEAETVLARAPIQVTGEDWKRYAFTLEVPADALKPTEAADFVISLREEARIIVDEVSLMPADNLDGLDPEMVESLRAMKTSLIRFGGNYTSGYHWEDGVGPRDKRPIALNQSWGMPEYNTFGTDELLHLCQLVGAEPMIALNLGSGTPEEAAGWVKYVNARWGDKKGGLLWELGNELWGNGWQIGYPTQERIAARTRAFSEAVRKVDPKARLIATGGDPDWFEGWNAQLYTLPPGSFDFVATHFVDQTAQTVRRDPSPEFIASSAFALPVGLARRLRLLQDQINGTLHAGKAHAAFTERLYSAPSDRGPDWTNMGGAIIVGGMLNMFMRDSDIVPVSTMTGIGHFHGQLKERGRVIGTPSYWAFRMITSADPAQLVESKTDVPAYDVHEGNNRLPEIPNVPYLDVTAALNAAGDRLSLFCVNRHLTSAVRATLQTGGFAGAGTAQTLHAGSIYERNSAESPENVHPNPLALERMEGGITCTFPPASVTVITLPRG